MQHTGIRYPTRIKNQVKKTELIISAALSGLGSFLGAIFPGLHPLRGFHPGLSSAAPSGLMFPGILQSVRRFAIPLRTYPYSPAPPRPALKGRQIIARGLSPGQETKKQISPKGAAGHSLTWWCSPEPSGPGLLVTGSAPPAFPRRDGISTGCSRSKPCRPVCPTRLPPGSSSNSG